MNTKPARKNKTQDHKSLDAIQYARKIYAEYLERGINGSEALMAAASETVNLYPRSSYYDIKDQLFFGI